MCGGLSLFAAQGAGHRDQPPASLPGTEENQGVRVP